MSKSHSEMDLDGQNVEKLYEDKNLWVASFEKYDNYLYFSINPRLGKKYIYRYNLESKICENLELRSNYFIVENDVIYYYNIEEKSICLYNINTKKQETLVEGVEINNMLIIDNCLYYSTNKSGKTGMYQYNLNNKTNNKITDECAEGMLKVNNLIYFIQTSVSYINDYPNNANGDGKLYCYNLDTHNVSKIR